MQVTLHARGKTRVRDVPVPVLDYLVLSRWHPTGTRHVGAGHWVHDFYRRGPVQPGGETTFHLFTTRLSYDYEALPHVDGVAETGGVGLRASRPGQRRR